MSLSLILICISAGSAFAFFASMARDWFEAWQNRRWRNSRENCVKLRRVTRTRLFNPHRTNMMGH